MRRLLTAAVLACAIPFGAFAQSSVNPTLDGLSIKQNGYSNFGATKGTNGYGFRDNGGSIQFKGSGGAWENVIGSYSDLGALPNPTTGSNGGVKALTPLTSDVLTGLGTDGALTHRVLGVSDVTNALSTTGDASGTSVTPTVGNTSSSSANRAGWVQDVRNFFQGTSANCATDVSPAINAAVTAGVKRISLPANCIYIPTGNTTPTGLIIVGEDWNTSIISVANRATDQLYMGPKAIFENVGIISQFCDSGPQPAGTQKICPIGRAQNVSDTRSFITNWVYQGVLMIGGQSVTGPTGVVSHDLPGISSETEGNGTDAIYSQTGDGNGNTATSASALRILTTGNGDQGIFLLNGFGATASPHAGIFVKEFSNITGNNIASSRIDRVGDGTDVAASFLVDDSDSLGSTNTRPFIAMNSFHQTSGNLLSTYQDTTPFSGNAQLVNMGSNTGTFTGNFFDYQLAGVSKFRLSSDSILHAAGQINASALFISGAVTFQGQLQAASSSSNSWKMTGAASGTAPAITPVAATDTNVSINLVPLGTGVLQVGGVSGVSCAAGSVTLLTLVVTKGIVTHC